MTNIPLIQNRTEVIGDLSVKGNVSTPMAHGLHLSASRSTGWVRIAQLNNMSGVEFWTRVSVSGNHSITKWIFTYTFFSSGTPSISVNMDCNSRYGTPWNNIRIVRKSTYDPVYLEMNITAALGLQVSQVSAFGSFVSGNSNITIEDGNIPSGYTSVEYTNLIGLASTTISTG